jgi:mannosyl-oligosaccharide alpha-1,2-mannosidase
MYKDKPYTYGARRPTKSWRRKRVLFGGFVFLFGLMYWMGWLSSSPASIQESLDEGKKNAKSALDWLKSAEHTSVDWDLRRERVKEAFVLSWDGYEQYAWGKFQCIFSGD